MPDERIGPTQPAQPALNTRGTHWEKAQLQVAIDYLETTGMILGAQRAAELAEALKIVRDGTAVGLWNCGTCADEVARYPVMCEACAPKLGGLSPQKMIFRIQTMDAAEPLWMAAFFGVGFVLQAIGRENSKAAAETLLDELPDEAAVEQLRQLIDAGIPSGGGTLLPN